MIVLTGTSPSLHDFLQGCENKKKHVNGSYDHKSHFADIIAGNTDAYQHSATLTYLRFKFLNDSCHSNNTSHAFNWPGGEKRFVLNK